jgi:hypothetical protein
MWKWRTRSDEDFAEEIRTHISHEMKRLVDEEGMSFADAKAQALRSFGNVTKTREVFYESRRIMWLQDLRHDVVYALRSFRRNPATFIVSSTGLIRKPRLHVAIEAHADSRNRGLQSAPLG